MSDTPERHGDDPVAALVTAGARRVATIGLVDPSGPRRRRFGTVAVSIAALGVLAPSAAAAYSWSTHTGLFGQPDKYTEDVDNSEVLNLCAPDFPATAR